MISDEVILDQMDAKIFREPIVKVESSFGITLLERLARQHRREQVLSIDFSIEQPYSGLVEIIRPTIDDNSLLRYDLEEKGATPANEGRDMIASLVDASEKHFGEQILFFRQPWRMNIEQCFQLTSIAVHAANSGALRSTQLYIEGGDWWYKPELHRERLDDDKRGGNLQYVRAVHFQFNPGLHLFDVGQKTEPYVDLLANGGTLNIFGEHLSGKTAALFCLANKISYGQIKFRGLRPLVTVYDHMATETGAKNFETEVATRKINNDEYIYLDDAHKLSRDALAAVRATYPKCICTSLQKLHGFDHYIDCSTFK